MVAQALADEGQERAELLGGIIPVDQTKMLALLEGQHLCNKRRVNRCTECHAMLPRLTIGGQLMRVLRQGGLQYRKADLVSLRIRCNVAVYSDYSSGTCFTWCA